MLSKQKNSLWGVFLCLFSPHKTKIVIAMSQQICYIRVVMINKGDVMNSISKTILLSAVSLFVDNGNLTYASEKIPLSIPKSGIHTLHTHHTHIRHTLQRLDLSSRLFDDSKISGKEQKVASVCFITDTGNCSGDKFGNTETPGGGNGGGTPNGNDGDDPEYDTIPEQCEDAGYTKTSCPAGSHLANPCPSDNRYYERCDCNDEYSELCNGTDQKGVGESCDGKYKECCNLCSDYPYSSVPSGYVSIGECDSCDGKRYQIKCDNKTYPINSNICGVYGGYGNTCTDDGGTYFEECKCPLNYEWSATALKCVCSSAFKYTCTGTGYAGGNGEACDGKYKACICASGYYWDATTGKCLQSCANECSLTSCPSPFTCRYEECSKRYCKTGCEAGYDWDASTQTCNSQCSASYKYDESNCPSSQYTHCNSSTCGGKYKDCKKLLFSNDAQIYKTSNATYAASKDLCPGIKDFVQTLDSGDGSIDDVIMYNGESYQSHDLNLCVDADQACYDLAQKIRNANNGDTISINQDMYCGNLSLFNKLRSNTITLLGNNHTLTFKPTTSETTFETLFNIDSLNIILQETEYPGRAISPIHTACDEFDDRGSIFYCYGRGCVLTGNININISDTLSSAGTYTIDGGKVTITCDERCGIGDVDIKNGGVMNIGKINSYAYADIFLYDGAILNIKDYPEQSVGSGGEGIPRIFVVEENTTVNVCNWFGTEWYQQIPVAWQKTTQINNFLGFHTITFNTNKPLSFRNRYNAPSQWESYIIQNTDSNVCSKMNF